jgi:hypothetical protein
VAAPRSRRNWDAFVFHSSLEVKPQADRRGPQRRRFVQALLPPPDADPPRRHGHLGCRVTLLATPAGALTAAVAGHLVQRTLRRPFGEDRADPPDELTMTNSHPRHRRRRT